LFSTEVLAKANLAAFVSRLGAHSRIGLFCVERSPEACHRSLVAAELSERGYGPVTHWQS
jgi:uncharacterized protein (DUF488 family)